MVPAVAEEMIQYLKDENDRLRKQASDLRSEAASIRHPIFPLSFPKFCGGSTCFSFTINFTHSFYFSCRSTMDEQCAEYQKLLMEENQKSKEHYIA
jgi:hypothetical protein